jgi:hypothetical protein
MTVEQVGYNSSDGATFGYDTNSKISFYGVTPVAQQSGAAQAALSTSTLTTVSQSAPIEVSLNDGFAFTSDQAVAVLAFAAEAKTRISAAVTLVNQLRSDLQDLGLIAGS